MTVVLHLNRSTIGGPRAEDHDVTQGPSNLGVEPKRRMLPGLDHRTLNAERRPERGRRGDPG